MIEIALYYATRGWPIFPLVPRGRTPVIPRRMGGRGCHDATTLAAQIEEWWSCWPKANIGLATGSKSGLGVVDIDVKNGKPGMASMASINLPLTLTVRTPTGGLHLYYKMPPLLSLGCRTDLLPGIDWRGNGGYVVAAGSVTRAGAYEIIRREPIVELPATLIALIRRRRPRATTNTDGVTVIAEGTRDDTLARIAGSLRRYGIGEPAIYRSLQAVNADHCRPPLEDDHLKRIAHSIARYRASASNSRRPK